jgi:hypothetical protein
MCNQLAQGWPLDYTSVDLHTYVYTGFLLSSDLVQINWWIIKYIFVNKKSTMTWLIKQAWFKYQQEILEFTADTAAKLKSFLHFCSYYDIIE